MGSEGKNMDRAGPRIQIMNTVTMTLKIGVLICALAVATGCKPTQPAASPCANRLAVIEGCKHQYALEHHKSAGDPVSWDDLRPYIPDSWTNLDWKSCPEGGGPYVLEAVGQPPKCSLPGYRHSVN